ncbi:hypothetical protein QO002_000892 [Pararhizobium capsulatum DSM 1112]|uniref:Lectin-like protein BA14k n=1 Tax=Pararhizobium capsulatum DSM 1112 TaxID=1121113 RepID=A0ABU0BKJ0_9HYPH|nr:BA14K family protein [Pararhizobium capsulatum]MDQ0318754.1 hypothetical protein [Pararhizobium capsulatum DSM 1112]
MKRFVIVFAALATTVTGVAPAQAFPVVPSVSAPQAEMQGVQEVRDRHYMRRYNGNNGWRNNGWRNDRYGSYGHHYYDHDYGWHGDNYAGVIIGGLAAGALLGSVLNAQPRYYNQSAYGGSHEQWCYNRYRSYRASDNTYQPYYGSRRQCVSP